MKLLFILSFLGLIFLSSLAIAQPVFDPPLDRPFVFPDTEVNEVSVEQLTVLGAGGRWQLHVDAEGREFTIEPSQRQIGPREAFDFELTFTPDREGEIEGVLSIFVINLVEGDTAVYSTEMIGRGFRVGNPEIDVDPEEIEIEIVEPEQQEFFTITVSNTGEAMLEIEWELDEVEWLVLRDDRRERNINPDANTRIRFMTMHDFPENGEHVANLTINSNDQNRPEIIVPITLTLDIPENTSMTIELERGWNMISTNRDFIQDVIDDEGPDMQLIFGDIIDQIILIKNGWGRFCSPQDNYWGIRSWETDLGYLVKTTEETELEVTGRLIPWDREINLHAGWNTIAYYPVYWHDLRYALDDLIERDLLILAKDGYGNFVLPDWEFQAPPAVPGQGYMLKVTENCVFTWAPEWDWVATLVPEHESPALQHFNFDNESPRSSNNMSVLIRNLEMESEIAEGSEIACITQNGIVAGAVSLAETSDQAALIGMAVWGDELLTEDEVEGFQEGEALMFILWDPVREDEFRITCEIIEGEDSYSHDGWLILDGKVTGGSTDDKLPIDCSLTAVYPNPFNSVTRMTCALPVDAKVSVCVYDLEGRLIEKLVDNELTAGRHTVSWDGAAVSSGVYVVGMRSGGFNQVRKIVLVK